MDIALNRQEQIITPPILMIQDSIVLAKNMLKTEAIISPISANVSIPLN